MRHRPTRRAATLAALLAIAVTGGCATDPDDSAGTTTSTIATPSWRESTSSSSPSTPSAPPTAAPSSRTAPPPTAPPPTVPPAPAASPAPPFIAAATWADSDYGATLKVAPTEAGRRAWADGDAEAAWREVLALAPDADTPGMWEQFDCHWTWARLLDPDKPTWNVEPWRPVVPPERMLADGCNPGGPEV